jgi:hypothetical protein
MNRAQRRAKKRMHAAEPAVIAVTGVTVEYRGTRYPMRQVAPNLWEPVGLQMPLARGEMFKLNYKGICS